LVDQGWLTALKTNDNDVEYHVTDRGRPGMTPGGLFCDCRFPSSAATHQQHACGGQPIFGEDGKPTTVPAGKYGTLNEICSS
jgi:hypothetical protein